MEATNTLHVLARFFLLQSFLFFSCQVLVGGSGNPIVYHPERDRRTISPDLTGLLGEKEI